MDALSRREAGVHGLEARHAHDGAALDVASPEFGEQRCEPIPGNVSARMAVQERKRWARAAVVHLEHRLEQFDHPQVEALEPACSLSPDRGREHPAT